MSGISREDRNRKRGGTNRDKSGLMRVARSLDDDVRTKSDAFRDRYAGLGMINREEKKRIEATLKATIYQSRFFRRVIGDTINRESILFHDLSLNYEYY